MRRRLLRFALRTTAAAWCAPLFLVAAAVFARYDQAPWLGDLNATAGLLGYAVIWLLPLLAGLVALDIASTGDTARQHLVTLSDRRPEGLVAATAAIPTMIVYAASWLAMTSASMARPHDFSLTLGSAMQPLVHAAAGVFAIGFGRCWGRLLPPLAAGPVAALTMLLLLAVRAGPGTAPWNVEGQLSMVGSGYGAAHAVVQVVILGGTGTLLLALPARSPGAELRLTPVSIGLAASAVLLTIAPQVMPGPQRYEHLTPVASTCRGTTPVVCGPAELTDAITRLAPMLDEAAEAARRSGHDALAPDRVTLYDSDRAALVDTSAVPSMRQGEWGLTYSLARSLLDGSAGVSMHALIGELTTPGHCPAWYAFDGISEQHLSAARDLDLTWLGLVRPTELEALLREVSDGQFTPLRPAGASLLVAHLQSCDDL